MIGAVGIDCLGVIFNGFGQLASLESGVALCLECFGLGFAHGWCFVIDIMDVMCVCVVDCGSSKRIDLGQLLDEDGWIAKRAGGAKTLLVSKK